MAQYLYRQGIPRNVRTVCTKTGEGLAKAVIQLDVSYKATVTDLKGFYRLERATPGDYKVSVSADGYNTQTRVLHISRGKIEEVNWDLW